MPLSDEELRLLEQMERALVEEDPKLASTLRGTSMRRSARRRAIVAGLVFVIGIAILMAGAITQFWPVGIVGFVIMLGSATLGLGSVRGQQSSGESHSTDHSSGFTVIEGGRAGRTRKARNRAGSSHSFMERMEERWRRRRDENNGF